MRFQSRDFAKLCKRRVYHRQGKTGAVSGRLCKGAVVEGCTDMSDFGSEFGYIHKEAKVLSNIDQPTQSDQSPDPRADKVRWRCCENVFCWQYKILRY